MPTINQLIKKENAEGCKFCTKRYENQQNYLRDIDYNYYHGGDHQVKKDIELAVTGIQYLTGAPVGVKVEINGEVIHDGAITSTLRFNAYGDVVVTLYDL